MQMSLPLAEAASLAAPVAVPAAGEAVPVLAVDVVRSARRRTLAIHVRASGRVEVRAPLRTDPRDINRFLDRHRQWVLRKLAEFARDPAWQPHWGDGGSWYWQGEPLRLARGSGRLTRREADRLQVALAGADEPQRWQRRVLDWHRREAVALLETRLRELFAQHCPGEHLREVECRWMRATWGTCSARRAAGGRREVKIRLNLWLAALPPVLAEAVMLHELAHVEHMHHGVAFYRRLVRLDPDWRANDLALRSWSRRLLPSMS